MAHQATKLSGVLLAAMTVICVQTTAYGQRERPDRPDSIGSRSIRDKDTQERTKRRPEQESPEVFIDNQLRVTRATANMERLESVSPKLLTYGIAGPSDQTKLAAAVNLARQEYDEVFKKKFKDIPGYGNGHTTLLLEDFARAYVIVLNPSVSGKLTGFELAELRSQVTVFDSYEEILLLKVPGLSEKTAKDIVREAKTAVKALLSK